MSKGLMTTREVMTALEEFGEVGFDDLPEFLKTELETRDLPIPRRHPTECEINETLLDAQEHRILNHEESVDDMLAFYNGDENVKLQRSFVRSRPRR